MIHEFFISDEDWKSMRNPLCSGNSFDCLLLQLAPLKPFESRDMISGILKCATIFKDAPGSVKEGPSQPQDSSLSQGRRVNELL